MGPQITEDITRIFAGFTSLCIIPRVCRYSRAFAANREHERSISDIFGEARLKTNMVSET